MVASSGDQAVKNGRQIGSGYSGMCQKYVRDPCWNAPSLYGSAQEAWNGSRDKHPDDRTPPKGAPLYYAGGNYGHAVIYVGDGKIRSTDCTSANDISEVTLDWPERAWGYRYLGWTGDINGVDLPLGGKDDEDMPLSDQDLEKIAKRVNGVLGDFNAEGDQRNPDNKNPDQGDARLRQIEDKLDTALNKLNKLLDA